MTAKTDLLSLYRELIPKWKEARRDEFLEAAKKHHPNVRSCSELISLTEGQELRQVPFLILHVFIGLHYLLLEESIRKFNPKTATDFISPEILTYDATLRLRGHLTIDSILERYHRQAVEGAVSLDLYSEALNAKLSKEVYGNRIIEIEYSGENKEKALADIHRMLKKEIALDSDLWLSAEHLRNLRESLPSLMNMAIADKIGRIKKDALKLSDLLPETLPPMILSGMRQILSPHERKGKEATVYSDAVAGAFRTLAHEFAFDFANERQKLLAEKRVAHQEISYEKNYDADDRAQEGEKRSLLTLEDKLQISVNQSDHESRISSFQFLERVKEELEKPRHEKLKPLLLELEKDPDANNTTLAKTLKINRDTVAKRRKDLVLVFKRIQEHEDLG